MTDASILSPVFSNRVSRIELQPKLFSFLSVPSFATFADETLLFTFSVDKLLIFAFFFRAVRQQSHRPGPVGSYGENQRETCAPLFAARSLFLPPRHEQGPQRRRGRQAVLPVHRSGTVIDLNPPRSPYTLHFHKVRTTVYQFV